MTLISQFSSEARGQLYTGYNKRKPLSQVKLGLMNPNLLACIGGSEFKDKMSALSSFLVNLILQSRDQ